MGRFTTFRRGLRVLKTFNLKGTEVLSSGAELNALDGVTALAAELEKLSGVTAGQAAASKAAVLGAQKQLDEVHAVALYLGAAAGTQMTGTAAELNRLAGVTPGAVIASKAAILGANKELDEVHATALYLGAAGGTLVNALAAQLNGLVYFPGRQAQACIDFNTGAAEGACSVTANGVVYLEADAEDFPNGVWTNGASAANSATSFAAAVNGDTRAGGSPFTALVSAANHSVYLVADAVGTAGNVVISTTSAARVTVENTTGGLAAAVKKMFAIRRAVTAQDVLATEITIPVPFTPTAFTERARDSTGLAKAHTWLTTIQAAPARIRIYAAGATALVATDVVELVIWE